jgi:hypothetical protein
METFDNGAASNSPNTEKFFADPVRGVFAVVETMGSDDGKVAQALIDGIKEIDPKDEQYLSLIQQRTRNVLRDNAKSAVSLAIVRCANSEQLRWIRAGAVGISLLNFQRVLPICAPRVWNPKGLSGEEYALPAQALGFGPEFWEQGFSAFSPGDFLALHTSGFPIFAPALMTQLPQLGSGDLQTAATGFVECAWRAPEPLLKGSTVVLVGTSQGVPAMPLSF